MKNTSLEKQVMVEFIKGVSGHDSSFDHEDGDIVDAPKVLSEAGRPGLMVSSLANEVADNILRVKSGIETGEYSKEYMDLISGAIAGIWADVGSDDPAPDTAFLMSASHDELVDFLINLTVKELNDLNAIVSKDLWF